MTVIVNKTITYCFFVKCYTKIKKPYILKCHFLIGWNGKKNCLFVFPFKLSHCFYPFLLYPEKFVSIYCMFLTLALTTVSVYPENFMFLTLALATVCVSIAGLSNGVSASESSVLKIRSVFVIYYHQGIILKVYHSTSELFCLLNYMNNLRKV